MKRLVLLTLLIMVAVAVISCGGTPTTQTPATPQAGVPPLTTTPTVNGAVPVAMENIAFNPGAIMIDKGTKVTWTNKDIVSHSVVDNGGKFDSGLLAKGGTFSYTFNESGTYNYYCSIHPGMAGTVTVK